MKLWLLERYDGIGYDENAGFVIRAETSMDARLLANERAADEGKIWLSGRVSCIELTPEGCTGILLRDFNAG